jgi:hypothetical protein
MAPIIPFAVKLVLDHVPELFKLFGGEKQVEVASKVAQIAREVTGLENRDEVTAAINQNPEIALKFKETVLSQQVELERLALERERLYVGDTQDARKYRDKNVFILGTIVLGSFAVVMTVVLLGAYYVATGQIAVKESVLTAVVGLVGAITGYFAANAQQVIGFFFGSSQGSQQKSDELADAVKRFK